MQKYNFSFIHIFHSQLSHFFQKYIDKSFLFDIIVQAISGGTMKNSKMSLAKKMVIALILGIVVGIGAIFLRVNLTENGQEVC